MTKLLFRNLGAIAGLGIALVCSAQFVSAAENSTAHKAEDCTKIESAAARLACFDAAYGNSAPPATTTVVAPATTESIPAPVAAPVAPSENDFGRKKSKTEQEGRSIISVIAEIDRDARDKLIFKLDNGQVWHQKEARRFRVKAGQVAEIRHGSFGSYKLYVKDESRWTRVHRIE